MPMNIHILGPCYGCVMVLQRKVVLLASWLDQFDAKSPTHVPNVSDSENAVWPDIAVQPSRVLPQTPTVVSSTIPASRTLSHSGTAEAFKTTFEVFPWVGPDNSPEGLTERSVGLIAHRPGN